MRRGWARRIVLLLVACVLAWPPAAGARTSESVTPWRTEGDIACGRIALVLPIGLDESPSNAVLRTLVEQDIDATIFPTGDYARTHPDDLRWADEAGFGIGVHGDPAIDLDSAGDEEIRLDLRTSVASIKEAIGRPIDPYYTTVAGGMDERVGEVVAAEGLVPVGWRVSAPGSTQDATGEAIYRAVVDTVYTGAIVGMPLDGHATDGAHALALPRIIDDLRGRGYEFVTLGTLLKPCPGTSVAVPGTITLEGLDVHGLHCKTAPSQGARMIRILLDGQTVPVRGPAFDGWLPVECAGQDGWIRADVVPGFGE